MSNVTFELPTADEMQTALAVLAAVLPVWGLVSVVFLQWSVRMYNRRRREEEQVGPVSRGRLLLAGMVHSGSFLAAECILQLATLVLIAQVWRLLPGLTPVQFSHLLIASQVVRLLLLSWVLKLLITTAFVPARLRSAAEIGGWWWAAELLLALPFGVAFGMLSGD